MAKKEFMYRGKTLQEMQAMSMNDIMKALPSRQRRSLKRGFTEQQKILLERLKTDNNVKTHCRDMIILPQIVGKNILIYNGKEFMPVTIQPHMVGHYLGEFAITRKGVKHSAPGIGATRSSASISVK